MASIHLTPGTQRIWPVVRSFKETLAANIASTEVIIPHGAFPTVRLIGFDGAGRTVQYTTSPEANITARYTAGAML